MHWEEWFAARFGHEVPELGLRRVQRWLIEGYGSYPGSNILIVGTNGKGTVATGLADLLGRCQQRTLLFTSPHLISLNERIRLGGVSPPPGEWRAAVQCVCDWLAENENRNLTYFEATFALATLLNHNRPADIGVWEAGLGGRHDAVNALDNIELTILTGIGLDHCEFLGTTVEEILAEKFAVARRRIPFIAGELPPDLEQEARKLARHYHCPIVCAGDHLPAPWEAVVSGWQSNGHPVVSEMARVMAWAMLILDRGQPADFLAPPAPPPGRWMQGKANWWLDVGHNPAAAAFAGRQMRLQGGRWVVWFGLQARKDLKNVLAALLNSGACIHRLVLVAGEEPQWHAAKMVITVAGELGFSGTIMGVEEGLAHGLEDSAKNLVFGSFRLYEALPESIRGRFSSKLASHQAAGNRNPTIAKADDEAGLRIDKWLWAVRLYKTRSLAAQGCRRGEVKLDGQGVKPSRHLVGGEEIAIDHFHQRKTVVVRTLISQRVNASIAETCYEDKTPAPPAAEETAAALAGQRPPGMGRPTKRDRRLIDQLRER